MVKVVRVSMKNHREPPSNNNKINYNKTQSDSTSTLPYSIGYTKAAYTTHIQKEGNIQGGKYQEAGELEATLAFQIFRWI